jgi:hypothetical protein
MARSTSPDEARLKQLRTRFTLWGWPEKMITEKTTQAYKRILIAQNTQQYNQEQVYERFY